MALINKLTAIADAIREVNGTTEPLTLDEMATTIKNLSSSGGGSSGEFYMSFDSISGVLTINEV